MGSSRDMAFDGFPRRVRFVPVPSPLFGTLLEQIDDLAELKCLLRVVWLLHEKKGYPRFVTQAELLADRTLARALEDDGSPPAARLDRPLTRAVKRGTLVTEVISKEGRAERVYALNTESDRKALATLATPKAPTGDGPTADVPTSDFMEAEAWQDPGKRANIFTLYEDNIAMLSPMIAEDLKEAEQLYPAAWIEDAFREAVGNNKRSWRYIARILERWQIEGRNDGERGRHPKAARYY